MNPILYSSITEGTVPNDYGVGVLHPISCSVKEVRNGEYELTMEYPSEGIHAESIVPNAFIKAKPNFTDNPQLFRIYKVGKTMNGRFEVNAEHASYLLSDKVIMSGSAGSAVAACALLTASAGNFTITTDKIVDADFTIKEPSSVRSWFGGKQGSILDVYGTGEWKYDNFSAEFLGNRGTDRGVQIRYGKNLTELSQTIDMSNLVSSVIPYYKAQDGTITQGTAVPTGLVGITKELAVDFSANVDPESATPITTQLATLATNYISNHNLTTFKENITLDFVQLGELSERVDLCDTVHIFFEPLGITATAKCIETVWDVLGERYTSTTFGDPKTNITDTIVATQKAVEEKPSATEMERAIKETSDLITGNLGGYVINGHDSNGDGFPDENLIMNTTDIATATKVIRSNLGGIGFSNGNGYAGPYQTAITYSGIVADAITTGILNANLIKAGVISDVQGNSTIDMTNGEAKMKNFKAVNSLQLVNENDEATAEISYSDNTGESIFKIYNASGEQKTVIGTMNSDEGQIDVYGSNNTLMAILAATEKGGYLTLRDKNGLDTIQLSNYGYNDLALFHLLNPSNKIVVDAYVGDDGGNFNIRDKNEVDAVKCYADANGNGHVEALNPTNGYMATLRSANNGGVVDVYDTQYLQIQLIGNGGVVRCVTVQQTSSRKVKENIKPMEAEEARKILDLEAVSFDYKNKSSGTNKRGFIAEDVAEVLPNLVTAETEELPASLDYIGMIPYLQAMIKEQEKRIEALEKKLNDRG